MSEPMTDSQHPGAAMTAEISREQKHMPEQWKHGTFTRPDGSPIETVEHVVEATAFSARQSERAVLWGVLSADASEVIAYTGNGPKSEYHAARITACVNALAGIDDPAAWVERAKKLIEFDDALHTAGESWGKSVSDAMRSDVPPRSAPRAQWTPTPHELVKGVTLWNSVETPQTGAYVAVDGKVEGFISSTGPAIVAAANAYLASLATHPHRPSCENQWTPGHYAAIEEFAAAVRASRAKSFPAPAPVEGEKPAKLYDRNSWPNAEVLLRCPKLSILRCRAASISEHGVIPSLGEWLVNWNRLAEQWQMSVDGGKTWKAAHQSSTYAADPSADKSPADAPPPPAKDQQAPPGKDEPISLNQIDNNDPAPPAKDWSFIVTPKRGKIPLWTSDHGYSNAVAVFAGQAFLLEKDSAAGGHSGTYGQCESLPNQWHYPESAATALDDMIDEWEALQVPPASPVTDRMVSKGGREVQLFSDARDVDNLSVWARVGEHTLGLSLEDVDAVMDEVGAKTLSDTKEFVPNKRVLPANAIEALSTWADKLPSPSTPNAPTSGYFSTGEKGGEQPAEHRVYHTLREANAARHVEWWGNEAPMTLAFRANELAGEVGEACNIIKKLERERLGRRGSRATKDQLAEELADVVICAHLIAMDAEIDLDSATAAKFNATSEKYGLSVRLSLPASRPETAAVEQGEK